MISRWASLSFGSQAPEPEEEYLLFKRAWAGPVLNGPRLGTLTEFDFICESGIFPFATPTGNGFLQSQGWEGVVEASVDCDVVVEASVDCDGVVEASVDCDGVVEAFVDCDGVVEASVVDGCCVATEKK